MSNATILIVEDEDVTLSVLQTLFAAEGYRIFTAKDEQSMNAVLTENSVDIVLMDINLPGTNGFELGKRLVDSSSTGLIFISGRSSDKDKLQGLGLGADDYITKPFNPKELIVRVRNLLARLKHTRPQINEHLIRFNNWSLDIHARVLRSPSGIEFTIPRGEFRALNLLIQRAGKIVTREELIWVMTGRELKLNDRTVDVTIRRIRQHFEAEGLGENYIKTVHGEGYRFSLE